MMNAFYRTGLLFGDEAMRTIDKANVIIFGIGGVGGFVAESLIRTGIKHLTIVDDDIIDETNINRQIIALKGTIGKAKVDIMKERLKSINPHAEITTYKKYLSKTTIEIFSLKNYTYIVDAIDTITSKIILIEYATLNNIKIISSMGTGNKIKPELLKIDNITNTKMCPLARVVRYELRKRNISNLKVVYSDEKPKKVCIQEEYSNKNIPASAIFVPSVAGILVANYLIRDIINEV